MIQASLTISRHDLILSPMVVLPNRFCVYAGNPLHLHLYLLIYYLVDKSSCVLSGLASDVGVSSLWSRIVISGLSHSVKTNINPSSFGRSIKLFDLSQLNEPVKLMGFNVVMSVISKLHMKKHSIPLGVV